LLLSDVAVALWVVVWIGLALSVGRQIADLDQLSEGLVEGGNAIVDTADALEGFAGIPFVGDEVERAAENVRTVGQEAIASGNEAAVTIEGLSTTFSWIVLLYPTVPVVVAYVAWRVHGRRRARAVPAAGQAGSA
jgi:hypothetical protein